MEQMKRENPDVVSSMVYGQTYERRNITLLKVLHLSLSLCIHCRQHAWPWLGQSYREITK
jgi:hypothetical protein